MSRSPRLLVALNGSPVRDSSIDRLLASLGEGASAAGGVVEQVRCNDLIVKDCQACGPDATPGYCVFHDDMDRVYGLLERAHVIVVASPIYFDTVSAQLKRVIDRCNCVTPLVTVAGGGYALVPKWARTRRGVFVTSCSASHRFDLAERTVRGFLKWVGAKWEETLAWQHPDDEPGSVAGDPALLERASLLGHRLIESDPLAP
ncbi:MAG: flavodoxin family protein [Candidatus Eisenbacteria bacterium]|uniref:Flavodoxin family protein n=1 Tax=Eiseniibacteriota bacterium TaxID=2212470 RepID=A0A849SLZ4_UNCEI|nr:flavodoxin family protein [Candidatus Eisenbacteria bacterium]